MKKHLVLLDIGQHDAMKIFAVKWNVVSEISKTLLNDIIAELDGSNGVNNITTDRLNLGRLQVATILVKIFWDFLMFYQIFLWPQVKQILIVSNKHGIYRLRHKFKNDLRLRILGT